MRSVPHDAERDRFAGIEYIDIDSAFSDQAAVARHRSLETRGRLSKVWWLSAMLCVCGMLVFTGGDVLRAHTAASSHSTASTSPPVAASPPSTTSARATVEPSITVSLLDSLIVDPNEVTIEVQVARSKLSNETLYLLQLPGGPHAATIWKNGDGHRHFLKVTEDSCAIYDGKELHGNGRRLSVADESSDLGEYHLHKKKMTTTSRSSISSVLLRGGSALSPGIATAPRMPSWPPLKCAT